MGDFIKDRILAFDAAAPRYTSYPPATAFHTGFTPEDYAHWLSALPAAKPVSLYVHVPFCRKLCYYCGCHTTISGKDDRIHAYIDNLLKEISLVSRHMPTRMDLSHLHFGGGSPTILKSAVFTKVMKAISDHFNLLPTAEIAIEADPRQMDEARISCFASNGVNRISLGVQDIDQKVMRAVNRPQPFHLSWNAVHLCRLYGIKNINLDLMYGLPGQTVKGIKHTIETVLTLKPSRIAFFGYAHVPWMKKHMDMIGDLSLPDASLRYDLYKAGADILEDAGYLPVGIDHFVRPSDSMAKALGNRTLKRNFQGYTVDEADTLIGVGASSIGKFHDGYVQNIADIRLYGQAIENGILPVNKGLSLTALDKIHAKIISEIMCFMAVDLDLIGTKYTLGPDYFLPYLERIEPFLEQGMASLNGKFVMINHPHMARLVARCFDPMCSDIPQQNRHARAI